MSSSLRYLSLNPYDLHKHLINTYVLNRRGATGFLKRDTSKDRTDIDVIRENHKFIWEEDEQPSSWEERLAKKYYDKLFKEFCIADLSRYKENMFAMRWQTEQELVTGKGQFICGNKICPEKEDLKTWEVNFGYIEHGEKKNALVKLRLCESCSKKLNYKHKRKEIKRLKRNKRFDNDKEETGLLLNNSLKSASTSLTTIGDDDDVTDRANDNDANSTANQKTDSEKVIINKEEMEQDDNIWKAPIEDTEESSRDEEFEKYLEHLLL